MALPPPASPQRQVKGRTPETEWAIRRPHSPTGGPPPVAAQPIFQAKLRYLKYEIGEERLLELVGQGKMLDEICESVDPAGLEGIDRTVISRWLGGLAGVVDGVNTESEDEMAERRKRYKAARRLWAEAQVETAGRKLRDETSERMANLRKAQAEFAMKVAGVHDPDYRPAPGVAVGIGVNVGPGQLHLDALRQRRVIVTVDTPQQLPPGPDYETLPTPSTDEAPISPAP